MMKSIKSLFITIIYSLLVFNLSSHAEEIRDYYSEPGLHPFKELSSDLNETIDPFSGTLQIRHQDLVIPGNGGMDITINRFYTSHQDDNGRKPGYNQIYGVGWSMHYGRIVVPSQFVDRMCNQSLWSVTTKDNPSLEHPDGARELLFLENVNEIDTGTGAEVLITKSNWKASCNAGQGMIVTSPNGTRYWMNVLSSVSVTPDQQEHSWYTSRIEDVYGNSIDITYEQHPTLGYQYMKRIDASGGRQVIFNYAPAPGSGCNVLQSITSGGRSWNYSYGLSVANDVFTDEDTGDETEIRLCRFNLDSVQLPEGQSWQYQYYPPTHPLAGKYSLSKITYPYGGVVDYTYQHVAFDVGAQNSNPSNNLTTSVLTKKISGRQIDTATWTYDFQPASVPTLGDTGVVQDADKTVINHPDGSREEFVHQGANLTGLNNVWANGLLITKKIYSSNNDLLERRANRWGKRIISRENYFHGNEGEVDTNSYAPVLLDTDITYDGNTGAHFTYYNGHDEFGNPTEIIETDGLDSTDDKVTTISYFTDPDNHWIIGLAKDETTTLSGETSTIDRDFFNTGRLQSETVNGVKTSYTYDTSGNVHTIKDANSHTTTKSNYSRGIAQLEIHPESVTIQRSVNTKGTVDWIRDGRGYAEGHQKDFSYDGRNRLTGITFPKVGSAAVSINWTSTSKILTRGNYKETVLFDGFGREIKKTREDLSPINASNVNVIETIIDYDEYGRKVFESYPNSTTDGTTYEYDTINRTTKITHPDASFRTYDYKAGKEVIETNERGFETVTFYRSFGHPNKDRVPRYIASPENICTEIQYNVLNQITKIRQAVDASAEGEDQCTSFTNIVERTYQYNSKYFLNNEINPETGTTIYGHDLVGNVTSSTVGSSPQTIYVYDDLNRLDFINYPNSTTDLDYVYDKNSNVKSITKGTTYWEYDYDKNDNLNYEELRLTTDSGLETYRLTYQYDSLDTLSHIIYPNGVDINYLPDNLGRPSQAINDTTPSEIYAENITYHANGNIHRYESVNGQITTTTLTPRLFTGSINVDNLSGNLINIGYSYDESGNVENITDLGSTNIHMGSMCYDGMDRLVIAQPTFNVNCATYDNNKLHYNYKGDITARTNNHSNGFQHQNTDYVYDTSGKLDEFYRWNGNSSVIRSIYSYDNYGNIIKDSKDDWLKTELDGFRTEQSRKEYIYDDGSNLTAATNTNSFNQILYNKLFIYDGNNQRTVESETSSFRENYTKHYIYSKFGQLRYERDETNCKNTNYIHIGSLLLAKRDDITPIECDLSSPIVQDDSVIAFEGKSNLIDVLSNDTDVDGRGLKIISVTQGVNGGSITFTDNSVSYTDPGNISSDSFSYTISDGIYELTANVNITEIFPDTLITDFQLPTNSGLSECFDSTIRTNNSFEYISDVKYLTCRGNINVTNLIGLEALKALEIISIDSKNLNQVTINDLPNLKELILTPDFSFRQNPLSTINLSGLPNLNVLNLSYNSFVSIDDIIGLSNLTNLKILNIRANSLESINPITLQSLNSLERLYLDFNNLSTLSISNIQSLSILNANNNRISSVSFSNLPSLSSLNLDNNELAIVDFSGLNNLGIIWIQNNLLTDINVSNLNNLVSLIVGGNPLADVVSLHQRIPTNLSNLWLSTHSTNVSNEYVCQHVEILKTLIPNVTITNTRCKSIIDITEPATIGFISEEFGTNINFAASAIDYYDGNISSLIEWSSNFDGVIGTGPSINTNSLSVNNHLITASVVDSLGIQRTAAKAITIKEVDLGSLDASFTLNYESSVEPEPSDGIWNNLTNLTGYDFINGGLINSSPITSLIGITKSLEFNGSNGATTIDFQGIQGDPTDESATFEVWFKPSDILDTDVIFETGSTNDGTAIIMTDEDNDGEHDDIQFIVKNSSTTLALTGDLSSILGSSAEVTNEFIQVVGTYTKNVGDEGSGGGFIALYINGQFITSDFSTSLNDWADSNDTGLGQVNGDINIGSANVTNFEGEVAAFRFYESQLNSVMIGSNYNFIRRGGPPSSPTTVSITSPVNNATFTSDNVITFTATSFDTYTQSPITNIQWQSNIDGPIGSGTTININTLTVGEHEITASVTDSLGIIRNDSINLTVNLANLNPVAVADTINARLPTEQLVNTTTAGIQWSNSIHDLPNQQFKVRWLNEDGSTAFAQNFNLDGTKDGLEYTDDRLQKLANGGYISSYTLGNDRRAKVYNEAKDEINDISVYQLQPQDLYGLILLSIKYTQLNNGNIVAAWSVFRAVPSGEFAVFNVMARVFDQSGNALTDAFLVSEDPNADHYAPELIALPEGGFGVLYPAHTNVYSIGSDTEIILKRYEADGTPILTGRHVITSNHHALRTSPKPKIQKLSNDNYIVVWNHINLDPAHGEQFGRIEAQLLDGSTYNNIDTPFVISNGRDPALLALSSGGFMAAAAGSEISAVRYDNNGDLIGEIEKINIHGTSYQERPYMKQLENGDVAFLWDSWDPATGDDDRSGVAMRIYRPGEEVPLYIDVLANDTDPNAEDTVETFSLDAHTHVNGNGQGTVSIEGGRYLKFDPGTDFDALLAGQTAEVVVGYTMSDDEGLTSNSSVTITIHGVNDGPVISSASAVSIPENTMSVMALAATDPESAAVSFRISDSTVHEEFSTDHDAFSIDASGNLSFATAPDFETPTDTEGDNEYNVLLEASDGVELTSQLVRVIVTDVNDVTNTAPTVNITIPSSGASVVQGSSMIFIGTANDVEDGNLGPSLNWTSSIDGAIGTGNFNNTVLSIGTHTITASATDSGGLSSDATITVTVTNASTGSGTVVGTSGNDTLDGTAGDDVVNGGAGNDTLNAGAGNDVYLFEIGWGSDIVNNEEWSVNNVETIRFGSGISPSDITVSRDDEHLYLTHSNGDSIRVSYHFIVDTGDEPYAIHIIEFDDGTVWDKSTFEGMLAIATIGHDTLEGGSHSDTLNGLAGNDVLNGYDGDDLLNGGPGDDTLIGSYGNDLYVFDSGWGTDIIQNTEWHYDTVDTIRFSTGINPNDITITRDEEHLHITHTNGDSIEVQYHFNLDGTDEPHAIDVIEFDDGTVWDKATFEDFMAVATTGDDTMIAGTSHADTLNGLAGNDTIEAYNGDDTLIGGDGNDTLAGGDGNDTYHFDTGWGTDIIQNTEWQYHTTDIIRFGTGINPSDITFTRDEEHLYIAHTNGDSIEVRYHFNLDGTDEPHAIDRIEFADSTVWDKATFEGFMAVTTTGDDAMIAGSSHADTLDGLAGNDTIYAYNGDDVVIGNTGNDTLSGGDGNDIYHFDVGWGSDVVSNTEWQYHTVDIFRFGVGINPSDISFTRDIDHMYLHHTNGDSIKIEYYYSFDGSDKPHAIDRIEFNDGTVWNQTTFEGMVP